MNIFDMDMKTAVSRGLQISVVASLPRISVGVARLSVNNIGEAQRKLSKGSMRLTRTRYKQSLTWDPFCSPV